MDFDVETAMKVCRQAGYHKHALFLAEKHNRHEWYLRIQLEDNKDYQKALEYIGKLEFDVVSYLSHTEAYERYIYILLLYPVDYKKKTTKICICVACKILQNILTGKLNILLL